MQLREEVKSVEFAAEKMQQEVLESMVPVERRGRDTADEIMRDVVANLQSYAEFLRLDIHDDIKQKLSIIIEAAFPAWDPTDIRRQL
jgi:hypothetical protein